jgi:hypothetical protein
MSQITINTLSGSSPFTIYVCDENQLTCVISLTGVTQSSLPVDVPIPFIFTYSPSIVVKIIDSSGCTTTQTFNCISQTPTPSITSTPSITPTITQTPTITSSNTPTPVTPTPTPTITVSASLTPTPSSTSRPIQPSQFLALLIVEPITGSTQIGTFMKNNNLNFLGFSNGTSPSHDIVQFTKEMNFYIDFFRTGSTMISFVQSVSSTNIGFDQSGNTQTFLNFNTIIIPKGTINCPAWYTFLISSASTSGLYQKVIDISLDGIHTFGQLKTDSSIFSKELNYTGFTLQPSLYRVYTTFPSTELYLDNSSTTLYFRGNTVSP